MRKFRDLWKPYINRQKCSECQLVTALNAYTYLHGRPYCEQDSDEYERLVDMVGARHGSAIHIERAWKLLGIWPVARYISFDDVLSHSPSHIYMKRLPHDRNSNWSKRVTWVKRNGTIQRQSKSKAVLPAEVTIWHPTVGYHSCLIIDRNEALDMVRVSNFKHDTHWSGWMFVSELKCLESRVTSGKDGLNSDGQQWLYRVFGTRE